MAFIATTSLTLTVTTPGFVGTVTPGAFVTGKTKVNGLNILVQQLPITVSGTLASCTGTGVGTIVAVTRKYKDSGQFALVVGDSTVVTVTGTTPAPAPCSYPVTVAITAAGQTKLQTV